MSYQMPLTGIKLYSFICKLEKLAIEFFRQYFNLISLVILNH